MQEVFKVEGHVHERSVHIQAADIRLQMRFQVVLGNRELTHAPGIVTGRGAHHEVPDAGLLDGINQVFTVPVFLFSMFPVVGNAKDAVAAGHGLFQAFQGVQIALNEFCAGHCKRLGFVRLRGAGQDSDGESFIAEECFGDASAMGTGSDCFIPDGYDFLIYRAKVSEKPLVRIE